ncbi:VanW family protein [Pseudonocardia sp. CA-107938]|uniref:VanW family protein n=1 Tax=Pseudonocardia sp. CA-107938 TaxID=3240021 RepID=UPI003D92BC36
MPERQATPGDTTAGEREAPDLDGPTVEAPQDAPAAPSPGRADGPPAPRPRPAPSGPTDNDDFEVPHPLAPQPRPGTGPIPAPAAPANGASKTPDAADGQSGEPAGDAAPAEERRDVQNGAQQPSGTEQTVVLRPGPASAWFEPWADDPTQALPLTAAAPPADEGPTRPSALPGPPNQAPISQAMASVDPITERLPVTQAQEQPPTQLPPSAGTDGDRPRRRGRKILLTVAALVVLAGLAYGGDVLLSQGTIPRGVTVAGVSVGGLEPAAAEQKLRAAIEPRASKPVQVRLDEATSTLDPKAAGLAVDWPATMAAAGEQPLNPITRLTSLFQSRDVDVVSTVDAPRLDAALTELEPIVNRPASEGNVRFDGLTPVAVAPAPGQELDIAAAAAVVRRDWVSGTTIQLPLATIPPVTSPQSVEKAIASVARPAVAAPFTVTGEGGTSITLTPQQIATVLVFKPGPAGDLIGEVNPAALEQVAAPAFAPSERPGRDATIDFATGAPVVVPSQDGRGVDYAATAAAMGPPLIGTAGRQVAAVYAEKPAAMTTEKLKELGITGLVSEFTTRGFAADSGQNIKRAAEQVNGTVVQPGETFSLNARTNPRDATNGYVEAGIIEDGHPSRGIGGGVSQVATTLYNAAYFAGLTLVEHKEHSFYISRYPPGREATVFDNIIDLKFRNDTPTAIMIQTVWTPSSITVRMLGTKYYEVTSATGPRTLPTEPKTVTIPSGEPCSPSKGAPGFTVTDTRTLRNLKTGEVRTDPTRTVRYNPSPIVECGS